VKWNRRQATTVAVLFVAAIGVLAFAIVRARRSMPPPGPTEPASPIVDASTLVAAPHVFLRSTRIDNDYNHLLLAPLDDPAARHGVTRLECERIAFAAGRGICLQSHRGILTTYEAVIFDDRFEPRHTLKLDGSPSRTRLSRDGRIGAITVFVTGQEHGYASASFSTKTTLVDMATGDMLGDLEQFQTMRNGQPFKAADFNFWGVTFAPDANAFYATLKTGKQTYLVRGDLAKRALIVLHENVECPSLSPDGRVIAYKKRVGENPTPWRFHLLDLATMAERPIAGETRSIDDQIEWLDDTHVLYAVPRSSRSAAVDVWIAPVDGTEPARRFITDADSPVVAR
jgi:hypothetical protein